MGDHIVRDVTHLTRIYGNPGKASIVKVADHLTPHYRSWVRASRLCILSTVGPEGTDASPRGDNGPVVQIHDPKTLLLPDWRGNNRIDSLRNIIADGRTSLMFFIKGSNNVIRVNGQAVVSLDPELLGRFDQKGHQPRSIVVITIAEIYSQCARALMRAGVWAQGDDTAGLPSIGDLLAEQEAGFDASQYDADWAARAKDTMW